MPDPQFTLLAATGADHATDTLRLVAASTDGTVAGIEAATRDIAEMPLLQHLSEVMPAADLLFGGVMLILVMLVHAAGMRWTSNHVLRRSTALLSATQAMARRSAHERHGLRPARPAPVRNVRVGRVAGVFRPGPRLAHGGLLRGNTYTTIGYGNFILPDGWKMLAPIIAMSGLFTFGWTGSVLVDLVGRCQKIKDAAAASGAH